MLSVEKNVNLITKDAVGVSELLTLFDYNETISEIPFRPKGGEIFIFKSFTGKKIKAEWKANVHT